ncbi:hypothetical protein [Dendrosporobacter sp. 1207_IL3150]
MKESKNKADAYLEYSGPKIDSTQEISPEEEKEAKAEASIQAAMMFLRGE